MRGSRSVTPHGRSWQGLVGDDDFCLVLQLVKAAVGYDIAGVDAGHLSGIAVGDAGLDGPHLGDIILQDVDKRCIAIVLYGGCRYQRDAMKGIDEQARIHELIRIKGIVLVGEGSACLDGTGGGVNLVVEGDEAAVGNLFQAGAIESCN